MSTKLPNKYADLLTLAYETKINVFDENHNSKSDDDYDNPKIVLCYGEILIPGMVVYFNGQQWTLSKQYGEPDLHGVWTNTEGETKSAYRFLNDLIDSGWPVEIIFNPKRHIPKKY